MLYCHLATEKLNAVGYYPQKVSFTTRRGGRLLMRIMDENSSDIAIMEFVQTVWPDAALISLFQGGVEIELSSADIEAMSFEIQTRKVRKNDARSSLKVPVVNN